MLIEIRRDKLREDCTLGQLYVNGLWECFTLEDAVRDVKIPGMTAIPAGKYKCIINFSDRFKKHMPLLLDVPNFKGVRIHSGNTSADTEGCILVGQARNVGSLVNSRLAFLALFNQMQAAIAKGEDIWVEVK